MGLSCLLGTTCSIPQENFPESHIISPLLTKLVWSRWLDTSLVIFGEFVDLESISVHKHAEKHLANIQPSWTHTWSITHTTCQPPDLIACSSAFWGILFICQLGKTINSQCLSPPLNITLGAAWLWDNMGAIYREVHVILLITSCYKTRVNC